MVEREYQKRQEGGTHYKGFKIEPMTYNIENDLPFAEGNVVKYVSRHRERGGKEDLLKAIHYIEAIIEAHYGDNEERSSYEVLEERFRESIPTQEGDEATSLIDETLQTPSDQVNQISIEEAVARVEDVLVQVKRVGGMVPQISFPKEGDGDDTDDDKELEDLSISQVVRDAEKAKRDEERDINTDERRHNGDLPPLSRAD